MSEGSINTNGAIDTFESITKSNPSIIYRSIIYRLCVPHRITKKKHQLLAVDVPMCTDVYP